MFTLKSMRVTSVNLCARGRAKCIPARSIRVFYSSIFIVTLDGHQIDDEDTETLETEIEKAAKVG